MLTGVDRCHTEHIPYLDPMTTDCRIPRLSDMKTGITKVRKVLFKLLQGSDWNSLARRFIVRARTLSLEAKTGDRKIQSEINSDIIQLHLAAALLVHKKTDTYLYNYIVIH